jgi:hypothetical protein
LFLGVAALGGDRPDVGRLFGPEYSRSGYGLTVMSLDSGAYDLAVFPWLAARGAFAPATVVRVTVR